MDIMNDEEIVHLQGLIEIHNSNLRKLEKEIALYGPSVYRQNLKEYEEKQLKLVELRLISCAVLKELEKGNENQFIVSRSTLLGLVEMQNRTMSFIEELIENDWRSLETNKQIEHLTLSSDRNMRLEILLILFSIILIQAFFESILIALVSSAIIWYIFYRHHLSVLYIPTKRGYEKLRDENEKRFEKQKRS